MAATRDIKLLGSVRGEAMQRQKNDCIWQQSRLFFKCSEWIPSSTTSGCGCISECVKNSFFVYSYVGVTGSWIVLGKEFWLDRCCWSAHAQAQCDMEQVTICDAGAFALVFIDCWMSRIWVSLTVWFVSSTCLIRLCSQGTKNIQVHCRIAERKCLWYQRKWCKCPSSNWLFRACWVGCWWWCACASYTHIHHSGQYLQRSGGLRNANYAILFFFAADTGDLERPQTIGGGNQSEMWGGRSDQKYLNN